MGDANVNEKSPGWRRLAAFRSNYIADCNKIACELFPELPRNRYTYENLKDSQKKRVFKKYKKLVKKAGRNKGKKKIEVNPVNLENFDDTEKLLEIIENIPQRRSRGKKIKETTMQQLKSSNIIISINDGTLVPIKCKSCNKVTDQKIFVVKRDTIGESGNLIVGFDLAAEKRCECSALHSIKFISED